MLKRKKENIEKQAKKMKITIFVVSMALFRFTTKSKTILISREYLPFNSSLYFFLHVEALFTTFFFILFFYIEQNPPIQFGFILSFSFEMILESIWNKTLSLIEYISDVNETDLSINQKALQSQEFMRTNEVSLASFDVYYQNHWISFCKAMCTQIKKNF